MFGPQGGSSGPTGLALPPASDGTGSRPSEAAGVPACSTGHFGRTPDTTEVRDELAFGDVDPARDCRYYRSDGAVPGSRGRRQV